MTCPFASLPVQALTEDGDVSRPVCEGPAELQDRTVMIGPMYPDPSPDTRTTRPSKSSSDSDIICCCNAAISSIRHENTQRKTATIPSQGIQCDFDTFSEGKGKINPKCLKGKCPSKFPITEYRS